MEESKEAARVGEMDGSYGDADEGRVDGMEQLAAEEVSGLGALGLGPARGGGVGGGGSKL